VLLRRKVNQKPAEVNALHAFKPTARSLRDGSRQLMNPSATEAALKKRTRHRQ
jgi:hypothetical protein